MAAAVVAVASVTGWALWLPEPVLRDRLARWQFWTFELQFLVLAGATCHQLARVVRDLALPARTWLLAAAIGVMGLVLVSAVAPRTSHILFDEQIYQGIGQSLADTHVAQMCNDGTIEYGRLQCWTGEYNKQPHAYPYVLSVAYRLVGTKPWVAHAVNNLATIGLAGLVFLIVALVFGDARAALASALILVLIPMQLVWGNTAAVEPTAATASALAVLAAFQFTRTRTTAALVWVMSATTFAASFRPECVLAALLVTLIVGMFAPMELLRPRVWWATAIAAVGGWNVVAHTVAVRHEHWGTTGDRMSMEYFAHNLGSNALFYLWDMRFPMVVTLLAALGIASYRKQRAAWVLLLYFLAFWGIFLFFYAGSYDYGADVRYSLMTFAPMAMLAGLGCAALLVRMQRVAPPRIAVIAGTALLLFHVSLYLPLVRAEGEEAWAARADVAFVDQAVKTLPANAIVLTHVPSLFLVRGVNAAQTSTIEGNAARVSQEFFDRYAGGVYLHWNFWCNVADPAQQAFCAQALDRYDHELVAESRVRNYRYAIYRLQKRPVPTPTSTATR
jgi:4-amino-4-deoxy-L-arabinose transferase-like glycosyltransferase